MGLEWKRSGDLDFAPVVSAFPGRTKPRPNSPRTVREANMRKVSPGSEYGRSFYSASLPDGVDLPILQLRCDGAVGVWVRGCRRVAVPSDGVVNRA